MIKTVKLQNFRNFNELTLNFSSGVTVILGPNASGKTNILEALYLLSTGKSFRARLEEEMINYGGQVARVKGTVVDEKGGSNTGPAITSLEVILTRGKIKVGDDPEKIQNIPRKTLIKNGVSKRLIDFAGKLKVVLFGPWDLDLVTQSPSLRRKFLDTVLSQVDREYRRASLSYEKGLRQRNRLLQRIRDEGVPRTQLAFWNQLLVKNGNYISDKRGEFVSFANKSRGFLDQDFSLIYDASAISSARLERYKEEEVSAATTLVGPHRDDIIFEMRSGKSSKDGKIDLARFGSRGEQRMGVLWLKMAELAFIEKVTNEKPTLLLDDIFSELDHEHREVVFEVSKGQQTVISTADQHYLEKSIEVERVEL